MKSLTTGLVLLIAMLAGCARETATTEQPAEKEADSKAAPKKAAAPRPPAPKREHVVGAGTSITVRTTNTLSTQTAKSGDTFSASLEEPLRDGESILVAKGADVEGRIVESDSGGRVKGRASISVQVTGVQVGGKMVRVSTNTIAREAKATKTSDAAKIGIGSGVGAAIGAIAGGGKGAAIGAAAGGAAGTGVVLGTRGAAAVIPAESLLIFELRAPLTIP